MAAMAGVMMPPVDPCKTSAAKTQGKSGLRARISAAVPTMTMPIASRPRFQVTASASAPPGI
jgi:hypothetical protein